MLAVRYDLQFIGRVHHLKKQYKPPRYEICLYYRYRIYTIETLIP